MSLHVAYVVEAYPTFVIDEVRELRRQGHEVTLLSAFRPGPQADAAADAFRRESHYFPAGYRGVLAANLRALVSSPMRYAGLAVFLVFKGESLRLLLLGAVFAELCRGRGVTHAHGTFGTRTTTLAFVVARLCGFAFSFTTHAYDVFHDNRSLVWKTRAAAFMRAICAFNRDYMLATYPGIPPERIVVQHLGVDTQQFQPGPVERGRDHAPLILSVASLIAQKGHRDSLRAVARLRAAGLPLRLEILGEGPERAALEQDIEGLGLGGAVSLPGKRPHAEVLARLRAADAFVLPCVDLRGRGGHVDGIPVALMEAMALGLPVVSTRLSGIPELIEDGVSGLLVAPGDDVGLAEAMGAVIRDEALRERLARAARERILSDFDLGRNTARLAALFAGSAA